MVAMYRVMYNTIDYIFLCNKNEMTCLYETDLNTVVYSGGFRGGKGAASAPPFWWLVMYFCEHNCMSPSNGMQQQQPGTVTHSRIISLPISRRLTRPRLASSKDNIVRILYYQCFEFT